MLATAGRPASRCRFPERLRGGDRDNGGGGIRTLPHPGEGTGLVTAITAGAASGLRTTGAGSGLVTAAGAAFWSCRTTGAGTVLVTASGWP